MKSSEISAIDRSQLSSGKKQVSHRPSNNPKATIEQQVKPKPLPKITAYKKVEKHQQLLKNEWERKKTEEERGETIANKSKIEQNRIWKYEYPHPRSLSHSNERIIGNEIPSSPLVYEDKYDKLDNRTVSKTKNSKGKSNNSGSEEPLNNSTKKAPHTASITRNQQVKNSETEVKNSPQNYLIYNQTTDDETKNRQKPKSDKKTINRVDSNSILPRNINVEPHTIIIPSQKLLQDSTKQGERDNYFDQKPYMVYPPNEKNLEISNPASRNSDLDLENQAGENESSSLIDEHFRRYYLPPPLPASLHLQFFNTGCPNVILGNSYRLSKIFFDNVRNEPRMINHEADVREEEKESHMNIFEMNRINYILKNGWIIYLQFGYRFKGTESLNGRKFFKKDEFDNIETVKKKVKVDRTAEASYLIHRDYYSVGSVKIEKNEIFSRVSLEADTEIRRIELHSINGKVYSVGERDQGTEVIESPLNSNRSPDGEKRTNFTKKVPNCGLSCVSVGFNGRIE